MVCDATRLEKSTTYCLQVARECAQAQKPFLVLLNMMDVIESDGLDMDVQGLSKALGCTLCFQSVHAPVKVYRKWKLCL
jgi:ferrous iron transport protein B